MLVLNIRFRGNDNAFFVNKSLVFDLIFNFDELFPQLIVIITFTCSTSSMKNFKKLYFTSENRIKNVTPHGDHVVENLWLNYRQLEDRVH